MQLTPDQNVFWQIGPVALNATIVFTWGVMALLVAVSVLATRNLKIGPDASRWQLALEVVVSQIRERIHDASQEDPDPYLPFIGTLFLYIVASSLVGVIPGVTPPTASLSTTAALAVAVFVAVPAYGVAKAGIAGYLKHYVQPTPFMLPFHVVSELSRTLALAVRLFGNMMSGTLIVAILLSVVPFLFPVVMELFGLLIGFIQAYVFAVLSLVYIASATRSHREEEERAHGRHDGTEPHPDEPTQRGERSHGTG